MSEGVGVAAGWLGDGSTAPPWMSDEAAERLKREAARERLEARREADERAAEVEDRADRLAVQARLSGAPLGRTLAEVLQEARDHGDRQDRIDDRRQGRAELGQPATGPAEAFGSFDGRKAAQSRRRDRIRQILADGRPSDGKWRSRGEGIRG